MSRQPVTGESTASINRRSDEQAWARAKPVLEAGGTLVRIAGIDRYATDDGKHVGEVTLTPAGVRRLEREGVLRFAGEERYGLTVPEQAP